MFSVDADEEAGAKPETDWIVAKDTLALVCRSYRSRQDAIEFLLRRAAAGRVRSRCDQIYVINTEHSEVEKTKKNCAVSSEFWKKFENRAFRTMDDWIAGDFGIRVEGRDDELKVRLLGTKFSRTDLLAELPKPLIDWMPARDALALVQGRNGYGDAASSIARRAHAGLIRSRARLFSREEPRDYGSKEQVDRYDAELPQQFWWAEGEAALTANWTTGDFSTWIDKTYLWQAFSVDFDRIEVEAMVAPEATSTGPIDVQGGAESHSDEPLPSDAAIKAKMLELTAKGMNRDAAAMFIRQVVGFEGVGNELARRVVAGELRRGRPPKSA